MTDSIAADSSHLRSLYANHRNWLQGWLRRKLRCQCDAEDLTQDTFVRLMAGTRIMELREPRSYLVTVARGLMIDMLRRRKIEQAYREALASLPEPDVPSAEVQVAVLESLVAIDAMFDGLGMKVKQTFILSQLAGLTYTEIAQRLNISVRSVNLYMAKAMEHLCRMIP